MSTRPHLPGVYPRTRKNGKIDYRASVTCQGKHIALGSYDTEEDAHRAYLHAREILQNKRETIETAKDKSPLLFEKIVSLVNYRDNGLYIPTPIYLKKKFFMYYLSPTLVYRFDIDDLFYFSSHKIMRRGSHLFVSDYGSQINILNRYGIRSHAVEGRDYAFYNGDPTDLRYENIRIFNRYHGVRRFTDRGFERFLAVINMHSNYVVGHYDTEEEAAIAYNKAADILNRKGISKNFNTNYIEDIAPSEYAEIYSRVYISPKILHY
ncbi:MAG: hypothetical protein IK016_00215 [Lachnospiraceae bacterium]|nr:hypothetical protein [Lachnospiraceae bacterium]